MAKLNDLIVTIGAQTKQFDKALGASMSKMRNFGRSTKQLGKSMTRSLTMPIAAMGAAAVKSAADLETMETSFISLTGGAKQAADMMKNLNEFTAKTPFQIEAVAKSARQLIASGSDISQVNDQLQLLGDIAATSGQPIDEIAAIFSKVNAKGKVELESLNQLAERGIPIFTALSEATGLPADKLGAGAVSVEQFNAVLQGFSAEGGFAAGAMERLSQTAAGKFSTALDNLKLAGAALAQSLMPVLKDILDKFVGLMQALTNLSPQAKKFLLIGAGIAAAIGPLLTILPALVQGFMMLGKFIAGPLVKAFKVMFTAMTSPIGLTVLAIAGLVAAFFYFWDDIKKPLANAINALIEMYNESEGLRIAIAVFKQAFVAAFQIIKMQVMNVVNSFKLLFKAIKTAFTDGFQAAGEVLTEGFKDIVDDTAQAGKDIYDGFTDAIEDARTKDPVEFVTEEDLDKTKDKVVGFFSDLIPSLDLGMGGGGGAGDAGMQPLTPQGVGSAIPQPQLIAQASTAVSDMAEGQGELNDEIAISIDMASKMEAAYVGIGMAIGGLITGTMTMADVFGQAIAGLANLLIDLGAQFIAAGVAATAFYANLIANPPLAIAAGVGLVAAGAVIKGLQARMENSPPALAQGGLAFGPTLAMVGDNQGAGVDPEVIAPLSKLQDMMGGQQVQVTGKISGRDILLTSERNSIDRNRVRGF